MAGRGTSGRKKTNGRSPGRIAKETTQSTCSSAKRLGTSQAGGTASTAVASKDSARSSCTACAGSVVTIAAIDPGVNGALVIAEWTDGELSFVSSGNTDPRLVSGILRDSAHTLDAIVIEYASARPSDAPARAFKFGRSYGGLIAAVDIGVGGKCATRWYPTPKKWQSDLGCLTGGDKSITRAFARSIIGDSVRVTNQNADAICLAEWARRKLENRDQSQGRRV